MRTLTFEQITDSRFNNNIEQLLKDRVNKIDSLFKDMDAVQVSHSEIYRVNFLDGFQYRCRFYIRKNTRKIKWNDIYRIINSVKPVPYKFI